MRIKCPECQLVLDIGMPKPGRYHPRCKQCGHSFHLKVTDDVPPKVGVARDPKTVSNKPIEANVSAATHVASASVAASPSSSPSSVKPPTSVVEPATSPRPSQKTRAGALDETIAPVTDLQQTMDSATSAVTKHATRPTANPSQDEVAMPARLGGYKLIRTLGRGAMGAVYEAKQLSLDRIVALKTIRDRLAGNPSALARFTREAYAAARLNHHNVVQIYDFGEDNGQHFFSMERVSGASLSEIVRSQGPLEARTSATYILQAARGLQFAHQSGMVHRDVKPANLMLSDDGIVKVADLGLVKVPDQQEIEPPVAPDSESQMSQRLSKASGSQVTIMGTAIGTPAYMAPEQAADATTVDHRADIYSLGCTLFYLLTGKPPFDSADISTLLGQHANEPIPQVSQSRPHVSPMIDKIIERSMAKRADDRYPTLAGMIADLEGFLGIQPGEKFAPNVAQADEWAANASVFEQSAPLARLRPLATGAGIAFSAMLLLMTPWIGFSWILLGPACLITSIGVSHWLASLSGDSAVMSAARRWLGSLRWFDWVYISVVVGIIALVAVAGGFWPGLIVGCVLGALLAAAYHYGLRMPIRTHRRVSLERAEKMLRQFRVSGVDENELRTFVARYSGRHWNDLFESLFGVEAMITMRHRAHGDPAIARTSATLRDRLVANLLGREAKNIEACDQEKLSRVEQRALVSEGLSESEARDRAWQIASALVQATKFEPTMTGTTDDQAALAAQAKRQRIKAMMADARSGKYVVKRDPMAPIKFLAGAQLRLVLGVALLAVTAMWAHRSGMLSQESIQEVTNSLRQGDVPLSEIDLRDVGTNLRSSVGQMAASSSGPISSAGIRMPSIAIAGLMLVATAFVGGWRMTPFALLAAGITIGGSSLGIPSIGPLPSYATAAMMGLVVLVPGAMLSERG